MSEKKFDQKAIEMVLFNADKKANPLTREQATALFNEMNEIQEEIIQQRKEEKAAEGKPPKKRKFVIPILADGDDDEMFRDRGYVIIEATETMTWLEVRNILEQEYRIALNSKKAEKSEITSVAALTPLLKNKNMDFRDADGTMVKIISKTPVESIPIYNNQFSK